MLSKHFGDGCEGRDSSEVEVTRIDSGQGGRKQSTTIGGGQADEKPRFASITPRRENYIVYLRDFWAKTATFKGPQ